MGGLNLRNPMETADAEFKTSAFVTEGLAQVIKDQDMDFRNFDEEESIRRIKSEKVRKENELKEKYDNLMERMTDLKGRKMVELATEKGAGAWLSAMPINSLGFTLNKQEFRDSICLRYVWSIPDDTPSYCQCGKKNDIEPHTLMLVYGVRTSGH